MQTPKAVVEAWVAALNARDAQAAASLSHDAAINLQGALGAPTAGRHAFHDDLVTFFRALPDTYTPIEQLLQEGEWAILVGSKNWVLSLDSVYVRATQCRWSLADQVGRESPEARDSSATPP